MAVAVVGVGESDYAFASGRSAGELIIDAIRRAAADAGIDTADIDGFVSEEAVTAHSAPAVSELARTLRVRDRCFEAHASVAGAGVVNSLRLGRAAIEAGLATTVVGYFGIALSAIEGGPYAVNLEEPAKAAFEMPFGFYGQPVYFGPIAQRYAHEYGLPEEHLGSIAVAQRDFARRTPNALKQKPLTMDDYLNDTMVSDPLRRLDCCLINDCAAAFIMTTLDRARDLPHPPVVIAGAGFGCRPITTADYFSQHQQYLTMASEISGPRAFADARLGPEDVDIAEIYDCFTISVVLQLEGLGFAKPGEGAAFCAEGNIGVNGSLPTNTHGGLLSQSYTVGANHVVEAVRQLRGERGEGQIEGAEVAAIAGLGAMDHATAILAVDR